MYYWIEVFVNPRHHQCFNTVKNCPYIFEIKGIKNMDHFMVWHLQYFEYSFSLNSINRLGQVSRLSHLKLFSFLEPLIYASLVSAKEEALILQ